MKLNVVKTMIVPRGRDVFENYWFGHQNHTRKHESQWNYVVSTEYLPITGMLLVIRLNGFEARRLAPKHDCQGNYMVWRRGMFPASMNLYEIKCFQDLLKWERLLGLWDPRGPPMAISTFPGAPEGWSNLFELRVTSLWLDIVFLLNQALLE